VACPSCGAQLAPPSVPGPRASWDCPSCGGRWIPSFRFGRWLNENRFRRPKSPPPDSPAPGEPASLPACPECGSSLRRTLAGKGLALHVTHCPCCGGLWEDPATSGAHRAHSASLEGIYTTLYRRERADARKRAAEAQAEAPRPDPPHRYVRISRRKVFYPVGPEVSAFLAEFGRSFEFPPVYEQLCEFTGLYPCHAPDGSDSLWKTVSYDPARTEDLNRVLGRIYAQLKTGREDTVEHLYVERVDYCEFGNSKPFRIRIVNHFNDNYDHFYVKVPDASRIFGLELEHALSPNRINYLVHRNSLIEEHIAGIPGDTFIRDHLDDHRHLNRVRVAKEFVKFTERSFVRLLGDMRTYNYVVDITPDFEEAQFRVRAIDFDQQSYEGDLRIYQPQFFKENAEVVKLCADVLNYTTMQQYQLEERTLIARRLRVEHQRLDALFRAMRTQPLSSEEKVDQLRASLTEHHHQAAPFRHCRTMAELVEANLEHVLSATP